MFALPTEVPPGRPRRRTGANGDLAGSAAPAGSSTLAALAERVRPTSWRGERLLAVPSPLVPLMVGGGLRRGGTLVVTSGPPGSGATLPAQQAPAPQKVPARGELTLALALVAAATTQGAWCAVVGVKDVGVEAAAGLGVVLERLALVPRPRSAWGEVTAAFLDGVELVVVHPPVPPRPAVARRLVARARERQAVLVVLPGDAGWPEPPDLTVAIEASCWEGAGDGSGSLVRRRALVVAAGRRGSSRPRRRSLWLPGPSGMLEDAGPVGPGGPGGGVSRDPVGPGSEQWRAGAP
ncbi:MAG: hypothetical protein ACP5P9_02170 [Acidimicrobiales bacterium]